jgi:predicted regulator of Ras-like GTPase activity (Roadblock/LC7/MglB family)
MIGAKLLISSVGNEQLLELIADRQVKLGWINGEDSCKMTDTSAAIVVPAMGEGEVS